MKVLIVMSLICMNLGGPLMASEYQSLQGAEAYETFQKLPGVACQEYRLGNYVVFTKYQTKNCNETQSDASKWNCTVQFIIKNGKKVSYTSADCSREI
ncbi:MAG: hypothetical protein K2Q18_09445 [Bdellovibrionales bacterium]|nr:hypothetical protein [Bdellovibrionales bacterium]